MNREEVTAKIMSKKVELGLSWKGIASELGCSSPIVYTAALLGQATLTAEEAAKAANMLGLTKEEAAWLVRPPERGVSAVMPPTDPLIYRFYELVQNYGTTWKALIEEEFGDGIMSAIDFNMSIEPEPDAKGRSREDWYVGQVSPVQTFPNFARTISNYSETLPIS